MTIEAEVVAALKDTLDAQSRALQANDMVTYRALVEQEVRYMDTLRVIWHRLS
jgi:hypothetical protein